MLWLLVVLSIYAVVLVAGRAHSRYLDRQEARSKLDGAGRAFVLWGSIVPCSSTGYVLLSDGDSVAFETTLVPDALEKMADGGHQSRATHLTSEGRNLHCAAQTNSPKSCVVDRRSLLAQAVEVGKHADLKIADRHQRVARHGRRPPDAVRAIVRRMPPIPPTASDSLRRCYRSTCAGRSRSRRGCRSFT